MIGPIGATSLVCLGPPFGEFSNIPIFISFASVHTSQSSPIKEYHVMPCQGFASDTPPEDRGMYSQSQAMIIPRIPPPMWTLLRPVVIGHNCTPRPRHRPGRAAQKRGSWGIFGYMLDSLKRNVPKNNYIVQFTDFTTWIRFLFLREAGSLLKLRLMRVYRIRSRSNGLLNLQESKCGDKRT